ncbi:MAG: tRNA (5-methylaminomethyl-2-thiouridine)(34)-methyltransferase MnmD [Gemmobacter sp.]
MSPTDQSAPTLWQGEVPVSARHADPYFALNDPLGEARHVFLTGNGLPGRFAPGFAIAELGFGTGRNLLVTVAAWQAAGVAGRFSFTSFEAWPMPAPEMARALGALPELAPLVPALLGPWGAGARRFALGPCDVAVIVGDARATLPGWQGAADAWFLDGFAPAKNPEMWEEPLLAEVARHTRPGGTAATYSAAGAVRRGLQAAGFRVNRVAGHAGKRHMSVAALGQDGR